MKFAAIFKNIACDFKRDVQALHLTFLDEKCKARPKIGFVKIDCYAA